MSDHHIEAAAHSSSGGSSGPEGSEHAPLALDWLANTAFLAAIVESSDDAIVGKTLDGIIRSWNPAAERMFGYTAGETVGRSVTLIIPPDRQQEEREILATLRRGERIDHFETVRMAKDGRLIDVSLTVSPIRDDDGRLVGASKIARDVGLRKRIQKQLEANEARFRALADNIAQLAWMADPTGSIFWFNERWYEFTGCAQGDTDGWSWEDVHHPDHVERVMISYRAAITTGVVWDETFPLRRHDGTWSWFLSRAVPIRDSEGRVRMWFGTNTDITERMEMERSLREADQRKDEFLATLAHELRNPLAPIASGLELLRLRGDEPELTAKVHRTLERQTAHLVRLVDDLLDVSRITRGVVDLRRSEVDLAVIIAGAIEASRPLIDEGDHELVVEMPDEPLRFEADPVRLGQVFSNLLNNAAKYTPPGGRITIAAERCEHEAVVAVSDTGVGFDAEVAESLFDLFVQGHRDEVRASGLGIGLTLVRSLVEMHGGRVTATSEGGGRGSRFTVYLPLDGDLPTTVATAAERSLPAAPSAHNLRVLIADDNRDAADALCELLQVLGHDARVVYGGESALEAASAWNPQAILLDLGMPGLDGYETAVRLRAQPGGEERILIALTGWGQEEDRRRTREAGFDHHLVKPADLEQLRELLEEVGERIAADG